MNQDTQSPALIRESSLTDAVIERARMSTNTPFEIYFECVKCGLGGSFLQSRQEPGTEHVIGLHSECDAVKCNSRKARILKQEIELTPGNWSEIVEDDS